ERFLAKRGNKIISQPIKGTARRGRSETEDLKIRTDLQNNPKEQSENVMIVELVRNDLSRIAARGSVRVDELFGIYSFRQLHQMISTVTSELKNGLKGMDAIKAAFPMGSMTGAPKIRAMQLIEEFESTKRGLYSGAVGYIDPSGDFDFNVVIRSIQFNRKNNYLNFMVGSAITISSEAEKEYTECLLKAEGMMKALRILS
ncbi:MAG TPA: anthranilate synthase component I family protein, partial [Bacteroidia bacterium]|nr:anthranilate synthase component I family protein [Bacteroidia bacterium]